MLKRLLAALQHTAAWIARHELWPTGIGVLLATASLRFAPWGLALLALLWFIRRLGGGRWSVSTPVDWPVGVLLVMGGISWLITGDRNATALALSRLLAGLALMYGIVNWATTSTRLLLLLWGGTLSAVLLALATPMAISWQNLAYLSVVYDRIPHLKNLLNPNMMAGALVMLLPFSLAGGLLLLRQRLSTLPSACFSRVMVKALQLWRAIGMPVTLLVGGALFFTQSRGAWLATGGVILVIGVGFSPFFLSVLFLPLLAGGWLVWRGQWAGFLDALGTGGGIAGWDQRVEIWSRALYMLQDFPFTGTGANTYPLLVNILYPLFIVSPTTVIPHAHNLYLQVGIDLGLPGLIAFLSILLLVFFLAVRGVRVCADDPVRRVAVWAGMASLIAMMIHGMIDATTWIVGWGAPLPWLIFGLLMAAVLHADAPEAEFEDRVPE
ncbi:MAG TPA: O-antigen ligase family protein [Anaerolineae bacterium]|nr:O-antigen ligase family protein [Anaerolineae bacterium]HQI86902.1 O-antigen ligase family protein [Anaerolineae bacterium]